MELPLHHIGEICLYVDVFLILIQTLSKALGYTVFTHSICIYLERYFEDKVSDFDLWGGKVHYSPTTLMGRGFGLAPWNSVSTYTTDIQGINFSEYSEKT